MTDLQEMALFVLQHQEENGQAPRVLYSDWQGGFRHVPGTVYDMARVAIMWRDGALIDKDYTRRMYVQLHQI